MASIEGKRLKEKLKYPKNEARAKQIKSIKIQRG
jgi:hypothetical protein